MSTQIIARKEAFMLLNLSYILIAILISSNTFAKLDDLQFTFRTGMVKGSYSNPLTGTQEDGGQGGSNTKSELEGGGFSVMPTIDIEAEMFTTIKRSYLARTIIGMDLTSGKMKYNYLGFGLKNYYKGVGIPQIFLGRGNAFKIIPKTRIYYGFDFGFSRVSVVSFGSVLSAVSTGFDAGANWGYTKQMSKDWGFNFQGGLSYAYGFSTVSAAGMNIKILFGATYSL